MAVSVAVVGTPYEVIGTKKQTVSDVTLDNSYPTGGEALTAADLRLNTVSYATCHVVGVGGTVNVANAYYDQPNSKLVVIDETPGEVANAADMSTTVVRVRAVGF